MSIQSDCGSEKGFCQVENDLILQMLTHSPCSFPSVRHLRPHSQLKVASLLKFSQFRTDLLKGESLSVLCGRGNLHINRLLLLNLLESITSITNLYCSHAFSCTGWTGSLAMHHHTAHIDGLCLCPRPPATTTGLLSLRPRTRTGNTYLTAV